MRLYGALFCRQSLREQLINPIWVNTTFAFLNEKTHYYHRLIVIRVTLGAIS